MLRTLVPEPRRPLPLGPKKVARKEKCPDCGSPLSFACDYHSCSCDAGGKTHKEIFSFTKVTSGDLKNHEWDGIVLPVIERWGAVCSRGDEMNPPSDCTLNLLCLCFRLCPGFLVSRYNPSCIAFPLLFRTFSLCFYQACLLCAMYNSHVIAPIYLLYPNPFEWNPILVRTFTAHCGIQLRTQRASTWPCSPK